MSIAVMTIFRNRLREENTAEYANTAARMTELAQQMPGFIDSKTFSAPDGERVTIVTFADRDSHNAWRNHSEHQQAQREGISSFYSEYSILVGDVTYEHSFRVEQ
jgi:heme-degrading monooxygenase HmoA